jgi:hypothetical protein
MSASDVVGRNNLDNFQRMMLNNPKTSLRNKLSDLGPVVVVKKDATRVSASSKRSKGKTTGMKSGELLSTEVWSAKPAAHTASGMRQKSAAQDESTQQPYAEDEAEVSFPNDVQDAAGYSELQAAFERAYEKMLKDPPVSVVDTVLSSAWKPRSKQSAVMRTSFQKKNALTADWDTRAPVYEKKVFYDSLLDKHCRRVVENPMFKQTLMRTRPAADHLLAHRVMDEESDKLALRQGKKKKTASRRTRHGKVESWRQTVQRFIKGDDAAGAKKQPEGASTAKDTQTRVAVQAAPGANPPPAAHVEESAASGGVEDSKEAHDPLAPGAEDGGASTSTALPDGGDVQADGARDEGPALQTVSEEELGRRAMEAVTQLKQAWGVGEDGSNAHFNSLNSVIMSEAHRPQAFAALVTQMEHLWAELHAPDKEVQHVRRFCMGEPSATNLAHLFYQVSYGPLNPNPSTPQPLNHLPSTFSRNAQSLHPTLQTLNP